MKGTNIFETATGKLLDMHDAGYLVNLGEVSGQYFEADRKIGKLQQEVAAALPEDFSDKLEELDDYFVTLEAVASEIYYKQGFADGISLILQSLMWQSVQR